MSRGAGTGAIYAVYGWYSCDKIAGTDPTAISFTVSKQSEHVTVVQETKGYGSVQVVLLGLQ